MLSVSFLAEQPFQHGGHWPGFRHADLRLLRAGLTNMALTLAWLSRLLVVVPLLAAFAPGTPGNGKAHLVHEAIIVALDQERGMVGQGAEQRVEPFMVGLGEIAEHMRR